MSCSQFLSLVLTSLFPWNVAAIVAETMSSNGQNDDDEFFSTRGSFQDDSRHSSAHDDMLESGDEALGCVVSDIPAKNRDPVSLRRWKKATLVLNAARKFRYTEDVERQARLRRPPASLQVDRAVQQSKNLANRSVHPSDSSISADDLALLVQRKKLQDIDKLGGVSGLLRLLGSSCEKGLCDDPQELAKLETNFGSNMYPTQSPRGFFSFIFNACKDPKLIILMVCAALSIAFGIKSHGIKEGWYAGASLAFAVLLVVLVTSISDYTQWIKLMSLNEEKRNIHVNVIRGGRRMPISIFNVLVGDVVLLNIGDQVPADGLFLEGHSFHLDESSMTGESEPVHVSNKMPFLRSGCKVRDGSGKMLVTGVGMRTEWGQLMAEGGEDSGEETAPQVRLNGVPTVAVLVFVVLFMLSFVGHKLGLYNAKFKLGGHAFSSIILNTVVDVFATAVTIVIVAVPEGLPLAVTLSLAYAMKKMMADRVLVRRLSACEIMGSATAICTDKTGTLTLNDMTVVKSWVAGDFRDPTRQLAGVPDETCSLLLEGIALNSSASINVPAQQNKESEVVGSPTEKAVLMWGLELGMQFEHIKSLSKVLQVETFNSTKKRAGVAVKRKQDGRVRVHWKGAAEIVLGQCEYMVLSANNNKVPLTESKRKDLVDVIESMAAQSLRCVAFGYMELDDADVPTGQEQLEEWAIPEGPLTLIGIAGLKDPCRPGVTKAVEKCQKAGIMVRMVTGDNITTAKAIATECGILRPSDKSIAIEGSTFRLLTDGERKDLLPKISVMASSSPFDKLLMVQTLRELEEVVAVTGDGANDALALREADIGLAMGIQGTQAAKESSDIIILDDNFTSVVKMVRWGRSVYLNIQKLIQFQLTVNVAALVVNFIAAVSAGDVPLTAAQLLWVNLVMGTLGAVALATEPPTDELLYRKPIGRKEPLISNVMIRNILVQAVYQIVVVLTLQFKGKKILNLTNPNGNDINNTIIFNSFVLCQLFNEINARKLEDLNVFKGICKNYLFIGIVSSTAVSQVIIVEFLSIFASTVKLSWQHWLTCIVIGLISWPIALLAKCIPVPTKPIFSGNFNLWSETQSKEQSTRQRTQLTIAQQRQRHINNEIELMFI